MTKRNTEERCEADQIMRVSGIERGKLKKACFVASSGGHWEELMCLKEIADAYDTFYVTEEGGQAADAKMKKIYTLHQINRHEKYFPVHFIKLFGRAFKILSLEKPDFLVTTGALIAYPFCLIGKFKGCKIIYIESFARVNSQSLTGRLVYPIADLFLVQWEPLLKFYPRAKFIGGVF